ncbi:MAG: hypothetical protein ACO1RX_20095 [Candidatus Sericytochromatia bacterium]
MLLTVLVERIKGTPIKEIAQRLGYRRAQSISEMAAKHRLDEIEQELRRLILAEADGLSPEAVALNQEYEERLAEVTDLIYEEASNADNMQFEDHVEKMRFLEMAARGLESTRQSRLKIAGINAEAKKKQTAKTQQQDEGYKSDYADLANDDSEEGEDL